MSNECSCSRVRHHYPLLKNLVEQSAKIEKELGVILCGEEANIGKSCEGEACSIRMEDCGERKATARFHTHPTPIVERQKHFSFDDIYHAAFTNEDFTCVGFLDESEPKIRCMTMPSNLEKDKFDEEIKKNRDRSKKYKLDLDEYISDRKKFHFDPNGSHAEASRLREQYGKLKKEEDYLYSLIRKLEDTVCSCVEELTAK